MITKMRSSLRGYEAKNIKNTVGMEGNGFTATLYRNGVKVGEAADYADGAMIHLRFLSKAAESDFATEAQLHSPESKYCAPDIFAGHIVGTCEAIAKIKRACSKKILVQLEGDDKTDSYREIKWPFNPETAAKVRAHYGDKLLCILNEQL